MTTAPAGVAPTRRVTVSKSGGRVVEVTPGRPLTSEEFEARALALGYIAVINGVVIDPSSSPNRAAS